MNKTISMTADARTDTDIILSATNLTRHYTIGRGRSQKIVRAVDGVDLSIKRGETFGIVGESGCGKSTLARLITGLDTPSSGQIFFDEADVSAGTRSMSKQLRRRLQIIFQDPYSSLNPRMTAGEIVAEPLRLHSLVPKGSVRSRVSELFSEVGLSPSTADRYPHQFSGGQRQRIGIARALACEPDLIVCDEAVSALDVSVQAQVINLLQDLQRTRNLTYVFISHNLSIVRHLAHRTAVMYLGRIVEIAATNTLFEAPAHPYTQALLAAAPVPDPRRMRGGDALEGEPPSPSNVPKGCRFRARCRFAQPNCAEADPQLDPVDGVQAVACFHSQKVKSARDTPPWAHREPAFAERLASVYQR